MLQLRNIFASVDAEAARKIASMTSPAGESEDALLVSAERELTQDGRAAVQAALTVARNLPGVGGGHAGAIMAYLAHPFRVARLALDLHPSPGPWLGQVGVLHNVFEVCAIDERGLVAHEIPSDVASAIRLLTIDRTRETDVGYLSGFYGAIEQHSQELSLIRCADKLDNLLGIQTLENGKIRDGYIDLAEMFVSPMARRLNPAFGDFFQAVIDRMRSLGCEPALKDRYDRFMAAMASSETKGA